MNRDPQDVEGVLLDARLAKARNDALEEAVEMCDQLRDDRKEAEALAKIDQQAQIQKFQIAQTLAESFKVTRRRCAGIRRMEVAG